MLQPVSPLAKCGAPGYAVKTCAHLKPATVCGIYGASICAISSSDSSSVRAAITSRICIGCDFTDDVGCHNTFLVTRANGTCARTTPCFAATTTADSITARSALSERP